MEGCINICEHGNEVFINDSYTKVYSECKECKREWERYRALERLMDKYPNSYVYCDNENCNNIFNICSDYCKKCGSDPYQISI